MSKILLPMVLDTAMSPIPERGEMKDDRRKHREKET
uniref:Uncharacterized protein n=1 Tax=Anguilla anguilla TaxID=7936 RepID=A0A0E9THD4_ANGAN